MQKYILAVAGAAVICGLCDVLMPKPWQKYTGILTGALLLVTLLSPFRGIGGFDLLQLDFGKADIQAYDVNAEIEKALERSVCEDIESRILTEFSENVSAAAEISTYDGKITGVGKITLSCAENPQIRARLYEVYGTNRIIFEGMTHR